MHKLVRRRKGREERGAAAIEFALVMIPLLLIIGGILNFGLAFSQKLALDNAVRQAARAAVVDNAPTLAADVIDEAETAFDDASIGRDGEVATFVVAAEGGGNTCEDSDFGDRITVTGTFKSKFLFPWPVPGIPTSMTWTSMGEFQCEYS
jgi:Flp pilus assembly protein TadG